MRISLSLISSRLCRRKSLEKKSNKIERGLRLIAGLIGVPPQTFLSKLLMSVSVFAKVHTRNDKLQRDIVFVRTQGFSSVRNGPAMSILCWRLICRFTCLSTCHRTQGQLTSDLSFAFSEQVEKWHLMSLIKSSWETASSDGQARGFSLYIIAM